MSGESYAITMRAKLPKAFRFGFDAPVEQVMYLDKPLRDHNLLQAIAHALTGHSPQ
jgi:CheY-like chemotaxis protein